MKSASPYRLRYSKRVKRLRLEVSPGELRVVAPYGLKASVIDEFVQARQSWIAQKLAEFASVIPADLPADYGECSELTVLGEKVIVKDFINPAKNPERAIVKWLDCRLMSFLSETQKNYSQLVPARIRLGNARTRWGSCSAKGVIMINRRLVHAPPSVVEYVFVHELVHLKHRNHSPLFWNSVKHCLGDIKPQKRWLRLQGAHLL